MKFFSEINEKESVQFQLSFPPHIFLKAGQLNVSRIELLLRVKLKAKSLSVMFKINIKKCVLVNIFVFSSNSLILSPGRLNILWGNLAIRNSYDGTKSQF